MRPSASLTVDWRMFSASAARVTFRFRSSSRSTGNRFRLMERNEEVTPDSIGNSDDLYSYNRRARW